MNKNSTQFVLVRPRNPKNIGAVARAMANFGFRNLDVVNPYAPIWRETVSAVNAESIVKKATRYKSLLQAISKSHIVIGTSAGTGRIKSSKWIGPEDLKEIISVSQKKKKRVSIVFGSEKTGLTNESLRCCHYILKLPTDTKCPSMNLGQAAALVSYLLKEKHKKSNSKNIKSNGTIPVDKLNRLIEQGTMALNQGRVYKGWPQKKVGNELRRAVLSWNLESKDVSMLFGLFRWIKRRSQ